MTDKPPALPSSATSFDGSVSRRRLSTLRAAFAIVGFGCFVLTAVWLRPVHSERRVVPVDAVLVQDNWADESQCIDCHEQAESFWQTGHARTLQPVTESESLQRLLSLSESDVGATAAVRIEQTADEVFAVHTVGDVERRVRLDWCFGSGHHAQTWASTLPDSHGATDELEFRWTWFHDIDGFDLTPGQPPQESDSYFGGLGILFDGPKARRCFSCHSSQLSLDHSQIQEHSLRPGVTCQRCHGTRQRHIDSEGEIHNEAWKTKDRMDAVHRCAQCHRREEEQPADEIHPDNKDIVRFQPVGLVQSACFVNSQMTCTTCHDPHRPLDDQDSRGISQCVQCHDPVQKDHVTCGNGQMDDCLNCHMPALQMDSPLKFTDHWIRVREPAEVAP